MAFTAGQIITASDLNTYNKSFRYYNYFDKATGLSGDPHTSSRYYCHTGGKIYFHTEASILWPGGCTAGVQQLVNGSWTNKWKQDYGTGYHSYTYNITQDGWYRANGTASLNVGVYYEFYCGQGDCKEGEKLVIYDDFATSGNRISDTIISEDLLNKARIGTKNI